MSDEFYIGWQSQPSPGIRRFLRRLVVVLLAVTLLLPVILAVSQRTIGMAVFEWGVPKKFTGIFRVWPYPHLLVPRPDGPGNPTSYSTYFLVAPWKFGLSPKAVARFDGKFVSLQGTLIYRDTQTMIEVSNAELTEATNLSVTTPLPSTVSLGRQTFAGEIVDSKCYFGVMNPGQLAPHRACAKLCISGGIPPVLVVPRTNAAPLCLLLVSPAGQPVNEQVLDLVAVPVEITGEVKSQDGLLLLLADPRDYRSL